MKLFDTLQASRRTIREFLRQYPDLLLAELLDRARRGDVPFLDCNRCLVGTLLRRRGGIKVSGREISFHPASLAYSEFYEGGKHGVNLRRLVPLIKSEMRRRMRVREQAAEPELVAVRR